MRAGPLRTLVALSRSPKHPDDDDGFFEPLSPPRMWAAIQPQGPMADSRNLSHLVTMRYHPGVTMDTRIVIGNGTAARELFVRAVQVINDANVEMRLLCEEIVN